MINLPNKLIFRMDRKSDIIHYNSRPMAVGVCIYMTDLFANYTTCLKKCSCITQDFEILTLVTSRPDHRFVVTICVYKPLKGNLQNV